MTKPVQFEADFAKLALAKKTSITLELPESCKIEKIVEIARHRGSRIIVHFGDPQMQFDLDDEEMEQSRQQPGVKYDVARDGTVENVEKPEDSDQQTEMFDAQNEEDALSFDSKDDSDSLEGDGEENGSESPLLDSDEVIQEPSKEEIEEFILSERPAYLNISYNFPELLQRKKNGETWIEIAKDLGENSSDLQRAWSKYKKEVAKQMMGGAA